MEAFCDYWCPSILPKNCFFTEYISDYSFFFFFNPVTVIITLNGIIILSTNIVPSISSDDKSQTLMSYRFNFQTQFQ